jgi:hypothetical protein
MNVRPERHDILDMRAFKRARQRRQMEEFMFVAVIFAAGLLCGWAITIATIK